MKAQIPWLRVFVEGVVIVGSILLALGLDEWREGVQDRAEVGRELFNVRRELDFNVELAKFQLDLMERMVEGSGALLAALESQTEQRIVSAPDTLIFLTMTSVTFQPSLGALDALIASGRLAGVEDPDIRLRLAGLRSLVDDAVENQIMSRQLYYDQVMPLLYNEATFDFAALTEVATAFWTAERIVGRPLTSARRVEFPNTQPLRVLIRERRLLYAVVVTELSGLVEEISGLSSLIGDQAYVTTG